MLLRGTGIDWGSGTGCLAIVAARVPGVCRVFGLEISQASLETARENAVLNDVADKVTFFRADSYEPFTTEGREAMAALRGKVDFVVANPSASHAGDGLDLRRAVLSGAREFLKDQGNVLLQISFQYGSERIRRLTDDVPGYVYAGILASTDWVKFDLEREELMGDLELYAREEERGGLKYTFRGPGPDGDRYMNARVVLERFRGTGAHPLSKWQAHLFVFSKA